MVCGQSGGLCLGLLAAYKYRSVEVENFTVEGCYKYQLYYLCCAPVQVK